MLKALVGKKKLVPSGMHGAEAQLHGVGSKIRHHYLLHRKSNKPQEAALSYLVDSLYVRSSLETARLHAAAGGRVWLARATVPGGTPVLPAGLASLGPGDTKAARLVAELAHGQAPRWAPVSGGSLPCLDLASDQVSPQHPDAHHLAFWNSLYDTHGYRPFNTY